LWSARQTWHAAGSGDRPVAPPQDAEPQARGLLGNDGDAIAAQRHRGIVLERGAARQLDARRRPPQRAALLQDVEPPAAGLLPLPPAAAAVPLAQRKQILAAAPAD